MANLLGFLILKLLNIILNCLLVSFEAIIAISNIETYILVLFFIFCYLLVSFHQYFLLFQKQVKSIFIKWSVIVSQSYIEVIVWFFVIKVEIFFVLDWIFWIVLRAILRIFRVSIYGVLCPPSMCSAHVNGQRLITFLFFSG